VSSLQNPLPPDPTIVVRAPQPLPEWARAWAEMQGHSEAERAVQIYYKRWSMTRICARWRLMGGRLDVNMRFSASPSDLSKLKFKSTQHTHEQLKKGDF
jgi:hypothetical protein